MQTVFRRNSGTLCARGLVLFTALVLTGVASFAQSGRLAVSMVTESEVRILSTEGATLGTIETAPGPKTMKRFGGELWVVNRGVGTTPGSSVSVIDTGAMKLARSISVCDRCAPRDLAFDANKRLWVVGQAHRAVYFLEPPYAAPSGSLLASFGWPSDMARVGRRLLIGFRDGNSLGVLDTQALESGRVGVGSAPSSLASDDGSRIAWSGSKDGGPILRLTEGAEDVLIEPVHPGLAIIDLALSASGDMVAVSTKSAELVLFEQASAKAIGTVSLPGIATQIAVHPSGGFVAASVPSENKLVIVSTGSEARVVKTMDLDGYVGDVVWLP